MSIVMACFLKMPAFSPRCGTAVSQLPRWPMVILTRSSAEAGCVITTAVTIAAVARPSFLIAVLPFLSMPDRVQPAEAAHHRVGADRHNEQHDQIGVHARHVEGRI